MVRIVKTEFYKLKRYHILWAGVALMLLSVLLTLFTSIVSTAISVFWLLLMVGIVALAMFLTFVQ